LDRDQDGMVTPTELQFMLRNLGIEMSDELIDGLMKEASKTGKIICCHFHLLLKLWIYVSSFLEIKSRHDSKLFL
jgi:Ca2+-binding EF-hand superfamily protein